MWTNSKFNQQCRECRDSIEEGDRIVYDPKERKAYCKSCGVEVEGDDPLDETAAETPLQQRARRMLNQKR